MTASELDSLSSISLCLTSVFQYELHVISGCSLQACFAASAQDTDDAQIKTDPRRAGMIHNFF